MVKPFLDSKTRGDRVVQFFVITIIILGVLFRIWASQPTWIHYDENYYINIHQNFVDRGEWTPYMWRMEGPSNVIAGGGSGYGIMVMIGWLSLFGDTLFSLRMLMVLAGIVTAGVYYLIAKKWWKSEDAGIAAMLFGIVSTSPIFTLVGRMDALGLLSYSLLLLLFITTLQQEKHWRHFLVGAAAILTVEVQTLGLLYVGALAVYYGVETTKVMVREKKIILNPPSIWYFAGAGLFGLIFLIVHVLPDPEAFFIIPSTCSEKSILKSLAVISYRIMFQRPIELVLLLVLLYSEIRGKQFNQPLFILFVGYFLAHMVVKPPFDVQYYYPVIPLMAVGLGGLFARLLENIGKERRSLLKLIFLGIAVIYLGVNFLHFYNGNLPYEIAYPIPDTPEINWIKEHIPESAVIKSRAEDFYPLREYRNFLDSRGQVYYGLQLRGESMEDLLAREKPIAVYMDEDFLNTTVAYQKYVMDSGMIQVLPELWVAPEYYVEPEANISK